MNTPICDFVADYAARGVSRLHMPGHKGAGPLGVEALDITEIAGADDLSCPTGIILESERNAASLFGARHSFYATGGSSQALKAMVYLARLAHPAGKILAGRNAHKSFFHACGLLGLEPVWMQPALSTLWECPITPPFLEQALDRCPEPLAGVFVTSPDYLGRMLDIAGLSRVCHRRGLPLLVDNAHGAYLQFLPRSLHPMALGADLCCDSAHKTLPVLTGGAYLHIGAGADASCADNARQALGVFGSSSPSYLILQSLDACNRLLSGDFPAQLAQTASRVAALADRLPFPNYAQEPLKLTLHAAAIGADGEAAAQHLRQAGAEPEYTDRDFVVLMFSPGSRPEDYDRVTQALADFPRGAPRPAQALPPAGGQALPLREAMLRPRQTVPVAQAAGRICASAAVSCPPAIPIAVMGEVITPEALQVMTRLGIRQVQVIA